MADPNAMNSTSDGGSELDPLADAAAFGMDLLAGANSGGGTSGSTGGPMGAGRVWVPLPVGGGAPFVITQPLPLSRPGALFRIFDATRVHAEKFNSDGVIPPSRHNVPGKGPIGLDTWPGKERGDKLIKRYTDAGARLPNELVTWLQTKPQSKATGPGMSRPTTNGTTPQPKTGGSGTAAAVVTALVAILAPIGTAIAITRS